MAEPKDYIQELNDKMLCAQNKYRQWLVGLPPAQILDHAYEYAMREDILCYMDGNPLSAEQAKALLRSPDPLADVYRHFSKKDASCNDEIVDSLESCAKAMQSKSQEREGR